MIATETPHRSKMPEDSDKDTGMARYSLHLDDCLSWTQKRPENSIEAIVTDPPYGLREYTAEEKEKLRNGHGGVWRIPPSFDGCQRGPLPLRGQAVTAYCSDRGFSVHFETLNPRFPR